MSAPQKTPEQIAAEQAAADAAQAAVAAAAEDAGGDEVDAEAQAALGDKGKQAIERMKADKKAIAAELARYKGLGLDPEALKTLIGKSETDAAAAAAAIQRSEAETAAVGKANARLVKAEIRAAATGKLADPALALSMLDVASFEVDADGEVDAAAITTAVDDLLTKYPYMAAQGGKRFEGTGDGGARNGTTQPAQLTAAQVKAMTPEQIVEAQNKGLLADYLAS